MLGKNRSAKINLKLIIILVLIVAALGVSLVAARQVRRSILSQRALAAGNAAFEKGDWPEASKQFQEFLGRNPDDIDILKKYAKARLAIRPIEVPNVTQAIAAYRRVIQLDPLDEDVYEPLSKLYGAVGSFEELAHIARTKLEHDPNDHQAPLWLADALIRLNKGSEAQPILEGFVKRIESHPDRHDQYVLACGLISSIESGEDSHQAKTNALRWLNRAVAQAPESAEALVYRAQFYRQAVQSFAESVQKQLLSLASQGAQRPNIPAGTVQDQLLAFARRDIEAADTLEVKDPRVRLLLGTEWLAHGQIDRVEAELQAADRFPQETIEEYFLDTDDWIVAKFLRASDLAMLRGTASVQDVSRADEILAALKEPRHRILVLPAVIPIYVAAERVSDARGCLDEYTKAILTQQGAAEPRLRLARLQALVARAEGRLNAVIDTLRPMVVDEASRPGLWRLLAEAYSRTDQSRRAVGAMIKYLRLRPDDLEMTVQLAKEYIKLQDWNKAFDKASLAESLDPGSSSIRLLRIESSIHLAASQPNGVDKTKLAALSSELAELRKDHPKEVHIRILQAIIAEYLDQSQTAERELKLAIEECAEPLKAEIQLVRHYYRTKRMKEAVDLCRTACKQHSAVAEPWLTLSDLHAANGDYTEARSCLEEGLKAVTGRWETRSVSLRLALLEILHGHQEAGITLLYDVAAKDPQEIRARSLLLEIRKVRDDQAKAAELIEQLKEAEGQSGLLWRLYQASLWLSLENWRSKQQDAQDLLEYCIDSDPEWSAPVILLAKMHEKLQDFRRVEEVYKQALARNPSAVDIADALMTLLEKQGRFSDAEKVLESVETNPRIVSAWNVRMALGARDFSRAITELELRVESDDRDASSRILLARLIYWQDRDAVRALNYLTQAEAITPGSMTLTAARVSILRAEGRADEARQILDKYVEDNEGFGAYMMRAEYLSVQGESERAEEDYTKLTTFTDEGKAGYEVLSNFYVRDGKLDQAIAALQEGLEKYPEDLSLQRRLMQLLFAEGTSQDRQRALDMLTNLEQRLPQDPELMKVRAIQYLREQTPQSRQMAKEKLQMAVQLAPTAVDAQLLLIGILMEQGQNQSARDCVIRAIGSNPNAPALLLARSKVELALENRQMAAQLARLSLKNDPNNTEARDVLLAVAVRNNDRKLLGEVLTTIESALNDDPANEELLISRARVLVLMELPQRAIPELEAYCRSENGKSSIVALVTLADMQRLAGDMNQAEQWIKQAESLDPNSPAAFSARCLWLRSQNRFEELSEICTALLSTEDKDLDKVLMATSILSGAASTKYKAQAAKFFEGVLALSPKSLEASRGLASTLYQIGDAERAKQTYMQLLEEHPDDIQSLNDLAWILQEHDHAYEAALELADKGLSLAPGNPYLLDTRGTILSKMSDHLLDARTTFEKLEELSPSDSPRQAKTLLKLGRICAKLNDSVRAKEHLEKALEIDRKIGVFTPEEKAEISEFVPGT